MSTLFDNRGNGAGGAGSFGQSRPRAASRAGRFRPTRAGLRNVWEYDDAVFAFAGGRMIFRGPNGSGKSNALALLYPFVLDGRAGATYMDPHGRGAGTAASSPCCCASAAATGPAATSSSRGSAMSGWSCAATRRPGNVS